MRAALLIALFVLAACGGHGQVELVGNTMGTQFSVKLPNGLGDHDALKLQKAIQAVLDGAVSTDGVRMGRVLALSGGAAQEQWGTITFRFRLRN